MTIRARLTLWYSAVLLVSLFVLGGGLYYEFVVERAHAGWTGHPGEPVSHEINEVLGLYALPAALITVFGGWWLTRKALAPISALTDATEKMSAKNLRERLPRTGNGDEVDRLSGVLNAMLGRLEASFAQEREFTLHASHELKTPLTVMRGQIETALGEEQLTASQRDLLAGHLEEIQRLAGIVDGLSLLAKADAGLLVLQREAVRFDELVRDITEDTRILALSAGISVELGNCEEITVLGDRHRLRQMLLNLAQNAVKHNRAGGWIRYSLRRINREVRLEIANAGPGIPPEMIPRVFDRFFRADVAHGPNIEGSGLGLSIAKWIVTAHGGNIRLSSRANVETTVIVQLPDRTGRERDGSAATNPASRTT
jgi:signal transduction histidine kinase